MGYVQDPDLLPGKGGSPGYKPGQQWDVKNQKYIQEPTGHDYVPGMQWRDDAGSDMPGTGGGAGAGAGASAGNPAMSGLMAAVGGGAGGAGGGMGEVGGAVKPPTQGGGNNIMLGGGPQPPDPVGMINTGPRFGRPGLAQRSYPDISGPLAALGRIY